MNNLLAGVFVRNRFPLNQRVLLFKRLALYLHSGISLPVGLGFIAEDTTGRSGVIIVRSLEKCVARGESLSKGLSEFPIHFDSFITGFLEAGEASGTLPQTLDYLAMVLEKRSALRKKILGACMYPAIIMLGTIAMAGFLTLFIFPKILPVLQGFHTTLPFATRVLITIDSLLVHQWMVLLVLMLTLLGSVSAGLRCRAVRLRCEQIGIRLPLLGDLYRYYALSTFLHVFALLLRGGIRIIPTIVLLQAMVPGIHYKESLIEIEKEVAEGKRLSASFKKFPDLYPPLVSQMVAAGETTGTLRENLDTLALIYEENLNDLTKNLTVLIEPVLMVSMGLLVGFVALAIITPIYQVTQNLNVTA